MLTVQGDSVDATSETVQGVKTMNTGEKIDYMIQCLKVAKAEYDYMAVKLNRRGLGCELKESYYKQAIKNLEVAADNIQEDDIVGQMSIEDFLNSEAS